MRVAKTHRDATIPTRGSRGAAGYDLHGVALVEAFEPTRDLGDGHVSIPVGHTVLVDTGIALEIPDGWMGLVLPRSSSARRGLAISSPPVDSDYRGSVKVILRNASMRDPYVVCYTDRIAQIVFVPVFMSPLEITDLDQLSLTARGSNGFGSTGV